MKNLIKILLNGIYILFVIVFIISIMPFALVGAFGMGVVIIFFLMEVLGMVGLLLMLLWIPSLAIMVLVNEIMKEKNIEKVLEDEIIWISNWTF